MIILEKCRLFRSEMRAMATGTTHVEGKCLVYGPYEEGLATVQPSSGAAGEVFAGFMVAEEPGCGSPGAALAYQGTLEANSDDTYTLAAAPVAGRLRVVDTVDGTVLTAGAAAANTYQLTGQTLAVAAARNGHDLEVSYNYEPTIGEYVARFGNGYPGGMATNQLMLTGVVSEGEIYTDQYDVTADWSNPTAIRMGADGLVTTSGSGPVIPGAKVTKLPGDNDAFIAIFYS